MLQSQALKILKTNVNVFLTGEPGSGKTYTINQYVAYLRGKGIEPAITASTGIAATHISGVTIHSWSGIGIKSKLTRRELNKICATPYISKRVKRTQVLIIEEVSMLTNQTLSMVDAVCRKIKANETAFGGMQVVFAGDFFQLPPVVKAEIDLEAQTTFIEPTSIGFAYDSPAWINANPVICYLTEQYRQDDSNFLNILSAIRHNVFTQDHLDELAVRKINRQDIPSNTPKLFSHNANVDHLNQQVLAKIQQPPFDFNMVSEGLAKLVTALKKGCLSPEILTLKITAQVMFTKNNPKKGFVNGTLGVVSGFNPSTGYPQVKTRGGQVIEVEPMAWILEENGKVLAQISQLPLRLAWAITVHKSQGMNLDEAVMDLSRVFEFGQGYVALSRVRRLTGLYILGWNARAFQVHPQILAQDEFFRQASDKAENRLREVKSSVQNNNCRVERGGKADPQ